MDPNTLAKIEQLEAIEGSKFKNKMRSYTVGVVIFLLVCGSTIYFHFDGILEIFDPKNRSELFIETE